MANSNKNTDKSNEHSEVAIRSRQGWNGLIPGTTQLNEAVAKLGKIESEKKFANGKWLLFADKNIQLAILESDPTIVAKIRVLANFPDKHLVPENIEELKKIHSSLKQISVDEFANVIYACPGVRAKCDLFGDPQLVKWIEFF